MTRDVSYHQADGAQFAKQADAAHTLMQAYVAELRAVPGVTIDGDTVLLALDMTDEDREKVCEITNRYFKSYARELLELHARMEGK